MGKSSFINASLISNESGIDLISSVAPGSVSLNLCSSCCSFFIIVFPNNLVTWFEYFLI